MFTELQFCFEVYPMLISIMEKSNPGTVIRIWAWDKFTKYWQELWSGPPQRCESYNIQQHSRLFTPHLAVCRFKTRTIRLELNHSLANYYTRLKGAVLVGTEELIVPNDGMINAIPLPVGCGKNAWKKKSNSQTELSISYHENDPYDLTPHAQRFNDDLKNFTDVIPRSYSICTRYTKNRKIFSSSTVVMILNIL